MVSNQSFLGNKTPLGAGFVSLQDVMSKLDDPVYVKIDLMEENKGDHGFILLKAVLKRSSDSADNKSKVDIPMNKAKVPQEESQSSSKSEATPAPKLFDPKKFTTGSLKITQI